MKDSILNFLKRLMPEPIFRFLQTIYHWDLGFLGALVYGFPSKKLIVIGVTGTKGKTTTCNLIAQILNFAGFKTGMATTVNFRIGDKEWINKSKQTMLGRFQLQKLLSEMVKEDCIYAIIETSSEGILQYRHRFIDYDTAVFTNLTPEHIERHGGFENYRAAKIKLFEKVAKKENGIGIYNLDDANVGYFLKPKISRQYVYALKLPNNPGGGQIENLNRVSNIRLTTHATSFSFSASGGDEKFKMPLIGRFNVYNAAAAICVALSQDVSIEKIKQALAQAKPAPGRLEIVYGSARLAINPEQGRRIDKGQNFTVIIDYAHEPASLEAVYKTAKLFKPRRIIALLGAQGGGRDKGKRVKLGEIAGKYANQIIITNEDPYDEDPMQIINDVAFGIKKGSVQKIIDRKEAIKKAISMAKKGDVVILTGKGGEVWMCVEGGKKISWDEKRIVEEELEKLKKFRLPRRKR